MNVAQKEQICIYVMGAFFAICYALQVTSKRGVANGISMTFMSLFKAAGPASAGAM